MDALRLFDEAALDATSAGAAHLGRAACFSALGQDDAALGALDAALGEGGVSVAVPIARALARQGELLSAMEVLAPFASKDEAFARNLRAACELAGLVDHPVFLQMTGRL